MQSPSSYRDIPRHMHCRFYSSRIIICVAQKSDPTFGGRRNICDTSQLEFGFALLVHSEKPNSIVYDLEFF